jgi:hypothetical protein
MDQRSKSIFSIQISPITPVSESPPMELSPNKTEKLKYWKIFSEAPTRGFAFSAERALAIDFGGSNRAYSVIYALLAVVVIVMGNLPSILIPQHDILKDPEYWPEVMMHSYTLVAVYILFYYFDYLLVMGNNDAHSKKNIFYLYIIVTSSINLTYLVANVIWIYGQNCHPPIPFIDNIVIWGGFIVLYSACWILNGVLQPSDLRFRKRLRWYIASRVVSLGIYQIYGFSAGLFEKVSKNYQPILAFAFPILRYGCGNMQHKVTERARGENELSARVATSCKVACTHSLYLAIIIGSSATDITACLICGMDSIVILKSCFDLVRMQRKHGFLYVQEKFKNNVQDLVIKETLELLLPLTYCLVLSISYFGPNAEIMGNIKNDHWQYIKIEDITIPLTRIGIFLLVDILRILLDSWLLWKYCKIGLLYEYHQMMETYWKPLSMYVAMYIFGVSYFTRCYVILVSCIIFYYKESSVNIFLIQFSTEFSELECICWQ